DFHVTGVQTCALPISSLCKEHPKLLRKGGLCVALVLTETAKEKGLPLAAESLRTEEGGQVAGLGKAAVQRILEAHGTSKVLAERSEERRVGKECRWRG